MSLFCNTNKIKIDLNYQRIFFSTTSTCKPCKCCLTSGWLYTACYVQVVGEREMEMLRALQHNQKQVVQKVIYFIIIFYIVIISSHLNSVFFFFVNGQPYPNFRIWIRMQLHRVWCYIYTTPTHINSYYFHFFNFNFLTFLFLYSIIEIKKFIF